MPDLHLDPAMLVVAAVECDRVAAALTVAARAAVLDDVTGAVCALAPAGSTVVAEYARVGSVLERAARELAVIAAAAAAAGSAASAADRLVLDLIERVDRR